MLQYLGAIRPDENLTDAAVRTPLSPRGEVGLQLGNLIERVHGIRETGTYRTILTAVAEGNRGTNEVAQRAGVADLQLVRRTLKTLESLRLVRRERNFRAAGRTPWPNRVADPAVRFWCRFVYPTGAARRREMRKRTGTPASSRISPPTWDKVVEDICREAFLRHHRRWRLAAAVAWARWEGRDRSRRSIEKDVAAGLDDGPLLTGEVKWSSSPVEYDLHLTQVRNLEDLGESRQDWARQILGPDSSPGHVYLSVAGFTEFFPKKAAEDARVRLIDLPEIYAWREAG